MNGSTSADDQNVLASIGIGARLRELDVADLEVVSACHELVGCSSELLELVVDALRHGPRPPTVDDVERLRAEPPMSVRKSVGRRLAGAPSEVVAVAEAAAVLGPSATVGHVARLVGRSVEQVRASVAVLADLQLVGGPGGSPCFRHPIEAAAVRAGLDERRAAELHAGAAQLLRHRGARLEDIAAHLLAAGPTGFDWAASTLRRAARDQRSTDLRRAVDLLRHALDEPHGDVEHRALLEALGEAEAAAGDGAAVGRFRALADLGDRSARLRLARALASAGEMKAAAAELDEMLETEDDPQTRVQIERHLLTTLRQDIDLRTRSSKLVEELTEQSLTDPAASPTLLAELAYEHALAGTAHTIVLELAARALGPASRGDVGVSPAHVLFLALLWSGDHANALRLLRAREQVGDTWALTEHRRSALAFHMDEFELAARHAEAGLEASANHATVMVPSLAAVLARSHLRLGSPQRGWDVLRPIRADPSYRSLSTFHPVLLAEAELWWALADADAALAAAEDCAQFSDRMGTHNPAVIAWHPVAAEALEALGRTDEAAAVARDAVERLDRFGHCPADIRASLRRVIERVERPGVPVEPRRLVRVLGDPEMVVDGCAASLTDDLVDRALRYLAVHDRPVHREELIEVLWPGVDPDAGRHRLRKLLSRMRNRHGDVVPGGRSHLALASDVEVDLRRFRRLAAAAFATDEPREAVRATRLALELVRGRPCVLDRYEDWATDVAVEFGRERDRLVARLDELVTARDRVPSSRHPPDAAPA